MSERLELEGEYSIDIPDGWEVAEEQGLLTLKDPEGMGALQIGVYTSRQPGRVLSAEELEASARRNLGGRQLAASAADELGGWPRFTCVILDEERFQQLWHVSGPGRVALLTYTCAAGERERHAALRNEIADSFGWDVHSA